MLVLLFETREGRYALPTKYINEIIPLVKLKKIPKTPSYIAGIINYRGAPIPVLDLCALIEGECCERFFSTRIILINYPTNDNRRRLLGMIAERVTETVTCKQSDAHATGVLIDENVYSKSSVISKEEMVQWFDIKRMVPESIIKELFQE